jgi:hypothetical protein
MRKAYWIVTILFALMLGFTAYAQLAGLQGATQGFQHLGFPPYFRFELAVAKFAGLIVLLAPVSARLKEWAYCGFAITLVSALTAHFSVGDPFAAWSFAAFALLLWALSYFLWRRSA